MTAIIRGTDEFVESIQYAMTRTDVSMDVDDIFEELRSVVQPIYEQQLSQLSVDKNSKVQSEYSYYMKRSRVKGNTLIDGVKATIDKLAAPSYEQGVTKIIAEVIARGTNKGSLDYRQVTILNYISALQFFLDTSRKLAMVLIQDDAGDKDPVVEQYRRELLITGIPESFVTICELISKDPKEILSDVKHLEGYTYDSDNHEAVKSVNRSKIDPLRIGFIPLAVHIPYQIGKARNLWRHSRIEKNKEEVKKIEFQLLLLEEKKRNASSSEIEELNKRIEYHSNRANKLDQKIKDYEEG